MPGGMFQRRIHMRPGARVIHQDHQTDRGPAEYVKGIKALVQFKLMLLLNQLEESYKLIKHCVPQYQICIGAIFDF